MRTYFHNRCIIYTVYADTHILDKLYGEHNMSHLPIYVVLTHIDIVAKMHFFGLADAPVTFLAQNSFGQPSIEDMCKTWTQRFLTDINVTVNGKSLCPSLQRNHPPGQRGSTLTWKKNHSAGLGSRETTRHQWYLLCRTRWVHVVEFQ